MIKIEIDNPKLEEYIARLIASQDGGGQPPLRQLPREALVNLHREIDAILSGGAPPQQHVAAPPRPLTDPTGALVIRPAVNPTRSEFTVVLDGVAIASGEYVPSGYPRGFAHITSGPSNLCGLSEPTFEQLIPRIRLAMSVARMNNSPIFIEPATTGLDHKFMVMQNGWIHAVGNINLDRSYQITAGADALVGLCEANAADLVRRIRSVIDRPDSFTAPPPPPAAPAPYESRYGDLDSLVAEGAAAWHTLLSTWIQNWGVDGAPQPDRTEALMTAFGAYSNEVSAYVRERGGLGGACIDTLVNARMVPPDEAVQTGKRLALNLVQVGTALGIPLDKLVEASLITETGKLSATPPTPGMVQDLLDDRNRPPELGDSHV